MTRVFLLQFTILQTIASPSLEQLFLQEYIYLIPMG